MVVRPSDALALKSNVCLPEIRIVCELTVKITPNIRRDIKYSLFEPVEFKSKPEIL